MLCGYSERLPIAFGLLNTSPGTKLLLELLKTLGFAMTAMLPLNSYQRLWAGKSFLEMLEGCIILELVFALVGTIGKKSIVKKVHFF